MCTIVVRDYKIYCLCACTILKSLNFGKVRYVSNIEVQAR